MTRNYWQRIDMLRHLTTAVALFEGVERHCKSASCPEWSDTISFCLDNKLMDAFEHDMLRVARLANRLRYKYAQRAEKESELLAAEWPRIRAAKAAAKAAAQGPAAPPTR